MFIKKVFLTRRAKVKHTVQKEALVLVGYAATMEAVQQFELTLKELAIQREELKTGIDPDTAWRRVERLLRRPLGQLAHAFPDGLKERYPELKRIRNRLAHEILLQWRLDRKLGLVTDDEVVEALVEVELEFSEITEQLAALADEHLRDLGVDPDELHSSRDEMRRMILGEEAGRDDR